LVAKTEKGFFQSKKTIKPQLKVNKSILDTEPIAEAPMEVENMIKLLDKGHVVKCKNTNDSNDKRRDSYVQIKPHLQNKLTEYNSTRVRKRSKFRSRYLKLDDDEDKKEYKSISTKLPGLSDLRGKVLIVFQIYEQYV